MDEPLVSCLMVTKNRRDLARRSIACFMSQTWQNKELVIIDDGDEDYTALIETFDAGQRIQYNRISADPDRLLGGLRNISLDRANGEYCMQWDDDEWYHPRRIEPLFRFRRRFPNRGEISDCIAAQRR